LNIVSFSNISNNVINTQGSNAHGITLEGVSGNNTFLNNNITVDSASAFSDSTSTDYINYLIYNNSYGEIRWIDNSTSGFLRNLDVSASIGLETNLFIGNNTVALNISAFGAGAGINSSANITLSGLALSSVVTIERLDSYSTSRQDIVRNGADCNGTTCLMLSYAGGTLVFNTTSFSSFTAMEPAACGSVSTDLSLTENLLSNGTCFNIAASGISIDCNGYAVNYSINGTVGYGVNNTNFANVIIENCNFYEQNVSGN